MGDTTSRRKRKAKVATVSPSEATTVSTVTTFSPLGGLDRGGRAEKGPNRKKTQIAAVTSMLHREGGNNGGKGGVGGNRSVTASLLTRLVAVNDKGQPIGEDHPRAVLANAEVDMVLELRGEGYSLDWLAAKMEVSKSCIQKICNGSRRSAIAHGYRRIRRPAPRG